MMDPFGLCAEDGFSLSTGQDLSSSLTIEASLPGIPPVSYNGTLTVDTDGAFTTNTYGDQSYQPATNGRYDIQGDVVPAQVKPLSSQNSNLDYNTDLSGVVPSGPRSPGMFMIGDILTVTRLDTGASVAVRLTHLALDYRSFTNRIDIFRTLSAL